MSKRFEPILASKIYSGGPENTVKNLAMIQYPVLCSVKWDGWRLFEFGGEVRCRSMKPPKNRHTQKILKELYAAAAAINLKGLDGEGLIGKNLYHPNMMQLCTSAFGSYEGEPDLTYMLFDTYQYSEESFQSRLDRLYEGVMKLQGDFPFIRYCEHKLIHNEEELMAFLAEVELLGGEGVMGRKIDGRYKLGRSTMREGLLWALKPYEDDEAVILEILDEMENQNEMTRDERGYAKRSGHQENLVPKGRMGRVICRSAKFQETFSVGAGVGLTHDLRQKIWDNQADYIGRTIKYKYQAIGVVDRPRQPKWMGFRDERDIG